MPTCDGLFGEPCVGECIAENVLVESETLIPFHDGVIVLHGRGNDGASLCHDVYHSIDSLFYSARSGNGNGHGFLHVVFRESLVAVKACLVPVADTPYKHGNMATEFGFDSGMKPEYQLPIVKDGLSNDVGIRATILHLAHGKIATIGDVILHFD